MIRRRPAAAFARWQGLLAAALRRAGVPRGRAAELAVLVVASVEGTVAMCRAQRDIRPLDVVARQLELVLTSALADAAPRDAPPTATDSARSSRR